MNSQIWKPMDGYACPLCMESDIGCIVLPSLCQTMFAHASNVGARTFLILNLNSYKILSSFYKPRPFCFLPIKPCMTIQQKFHLTFQVITSSVCTCNNTKCHPCQHGGLFHPVLLVMDFWIAWTHY